MNNEIAVSIIMPVYNSQEYLEETIKSVLQNDFPNFELICIDDGSTDDSAQILDRLKDTDHRLRVIHKTNSGVSDTRNYGISIAKGEYIGFCDNDDLVTDKFIEDNYKIVKGNDLDVLKFGAEWLLIEKGETICRRQLSISKDGILKDNEIYDSYYEAQRIIGCVWDHLYRRELLIQNNIKFPKHFKGGYEDLYFNILVLKHSKKIGFNGSKIYYKWMNREEHSTSRKFVPELLNGIIETLEAEASIYHEHKNHIDNYAFFRVLLERYLNSYLDTLALKKCTWTHKEKVDSLKRIRNIEIFDEIKLSKDELKEVKKNKKTYAYYLLFINKKLGTLITLKTLYNRLRKM